MTDGKYESAENRFGIRGVYLPGPRWIWIWLRRLVVLGIVLVAAAIIVLWLYFAALGRTVPSIAKLKQYEPPITSRVHAGDGTLIAEFAKEHRVFVPYESIPTHVIDAFVAAEEKALAADSDPSTDAALSALLEAADKAVPAPRLSGGGSNSKQPDKGTPVERSRSGR